MRLLLAISVLIGLTANAQSPQDQVTPTNINTKYLEHLIKEKVDSVRISLNLKPLANDSTCFLAAKDHSEYMVKEKSFSHNQVRSPQKEKPQDRVNFYGGVNYLAGENLGRTYINKRMRDKKGNEYYNNSYADLAKDIVNGWINSKGHYANMITPNYEVTGLALSIDTARQEIRVAQVFAEVQFKYNFIENTSMFPYSNWTPEKQYTSLKDVPAKPKPEKYPFRLKAPDDSLELCQSCNVAIDTALYKNKLQIKGRRIVFYSPNLEMMYALLDHRKNGLALEFVPYKPVDCGNNEFYTLPSRRNNQSLLNGTITEPLYRKDLKKGFKRSGYKWFHRMRNKNEATHFEYTLGRMPRDLEGYQEVNVLVIQKKKICRVMHLTNVCGDEMELFYDVPYLTKLNKYQYSVNPREQELAFRVPFEQGKFKYAYEDIKPLLDSVSSESFSIQGAKIKAFSSLEGSKSINEALQKKRAISIVRALEDKQRSEIQSDITTSENWKVFEKQISTEDDLADLRELSHEQIRNKLSDRDYVKKIEPYLAEQRYAQITLTVKLDITDAGVGDFLINEFSRYKDSVIKDIGSLGMTKEAKLNLDTMASIQWYTYHLIKAGKIDTNLFAKLTVPLTQDYSKLIKDHLWYDLDIHGSGEGNEQWETNFYTQLNQLDRLGISSFEIRYDVMNYLIRNWKSRLPYQGDISRLVDDLTVLQKVAKTDTTRELVNKLLVNYHIANANHTHFSKRASRDDEAMRSSMVALLTHFMEHPSNDQEMYKLASFFAWGEQEDLAYQALIGIVNKEKPYPPALQLFYKIMFQHKEEYPETDFYEALMNSRQKLSKEEWCSMFVGPCNLSFQLFDNETLRNMYCKECAKIKNYAQRPEDWED